VSRVSKNKLNWHKSLKEVKWRSKKRGVFKRARSRRESKEDAIKRLREMWLKQKKNIEKSTIETKTKVKSREKLFIVIAPVTWKEWEHMAQCE